MQPSIIKISKIHYQLSETHPIIGSCNLHPARSEPRWDMHYGLELGLVYWGVQHRLFQQKFEMDVKPGDVWFCGMWEPHGASVITAPCEVLVFKIWPPFLAQMRFPEAPDFNALGLFNAPPKRRPRIDRKQRETMINFSKQLKQILTFDTPYQAVKLRLVLLEMLACICEAWPEAACRGRRAPSKEFSQINRALEMVFDNQAFVATADAARACGMNRHAFSTLFRSWMNISFAEFSARHRLHQAIAQLRDTDDPVKSVVMKWGYVDESHFYRIFFKHFGFSPGEYRKKLCNEQNSGRNL